MVSFHPVFNVVIVVFFATVSVQFLQLHSSLLRRLVNMFLDFVKSLTFKLDGVNVVGSSGVIFKEDITPHAILRDGKRAAKVAVNFLQKFCGAECRNLTRFPPLSLFHA